MLIQIGTPPATASGSETGPGWLPGPPPQTTAAELGAVAVRPARIADMRQVEPLINGFAARDLMLPKTPDQLLRNFREFAVAETAAGDLVGCGALRVYSQELAEIVSLAVQPRAHGAGVGGRLVQHLVEDARGLGIQTVFALTLRDGFFHRLGFRTVAKERFPLKVWADCRTCPKLHACDEIAVALQL